MTLYSYSMKSRNQAVARQRGFTLIEIAIVLLLVVILLGYTVAMFPVQQELKQYRTAEREMDLIVGELIAYAQVNGRLPCPDTTGDGEENRVGTNDCTGFFGFLPARTMGINGKYDTNGLLVDPWSSGYGYAVSEFNANIAGGGNADIDLVTANGIRDEGLANVVPDLFVCDDSGVLGNHLDCAAAGSNQVAGNVAAVVVSLGKDLDIPATSNIQAENLDDFNDGTNDKVYISASRRDDYDDVTRWISTNLLFSRMIEAGQLP